MLAAEIEVCRFRLRIERLRLAVQRQACLRHNGEFPVAVERLTEKLKRASGVAARATAAIEARADALIAREEAIGKRTHDVFRPHEHVLDTAERGLDDAEAALRLLSNDPLDGSDVGGNVPSGAEGGSTDARPLSNGR